MAASVTANGYGASSVERVIERAGVSRGTFYEHFSNRHECLLAAQREALECFLARIAEVCERRGRWADKAADAVALTVALAANSREQARLIALDAIAVDGVAARYGLEAGEQLAVKLRSGRDHHPAAAQLPELTERFLIGAVAGAINWRLLSDESLDGLAPQLIYLVLMPYVGRAGARRAAGER